jgi:hypothetical protein
MSTDNLTGGRRHAAESVDALVGLRARFLEGELALAH